MPKRLEDLDLTEISGVDHPAHLVEGYMVMKSKKGGSMSLERDLDEIFAKAQEFQKAHGDLLSALDGVAEYIDDDTPDEIRTAVETLRGYAASIEAEDEPVVEDTETEAEEAEVQPTKKSSLLSRLADLIRKHDPDLLSDEEIEAGFVEVDDEVEKASKCPECGANMSKGTCSCGYSMAKAAVAQVIEAIQKGDADGVAKAIEEHIAPLVQKEDDVAEETYEGLVEELTKAVTEVVKSKDAELEELKSEVAKARENEETFMKAFEGILGRLETIEKHLTGRTSADGQEGGEEPVQKSAEEQQAEQWNRAITTATNGHKVRLT